MPSHHQLSQFLPNLDESQMQLATEVIRQPPVVVMDAQVSRADLTDPQLLLLVRTGGHRVAVFLLGHCLLLADVFNLELEVKSEDSV